MAVCDEYGPTRMLREHDWKYVHRYPEGPHELYCLAEDPGEQYNLVDVAAHSQILKRMRRDLEAWFDQYVQVALDGKNQPVTGKGQVDAIDPSQVESVAFV